MAAELRAVAPGVWALETHLTMLATVNLPLRGTVVQLDDDDLAIISPPPIDNDTANALDGLGEVKHVIAPNRFHHLSVSAAASRWPAAQVHVASALKTKRADLAEALDLPDHLPSLLQAFPVAGAPGLDETALLHRPSRSLIVTDLIFNVQQPKGFWTHIFLALGGARKRCAVDRVVKLLVKDKAAFRESLARIAAADFDRVIMAHGDIIDADTARATLAA